MSLYSQLDIADTSLWLIALGVCLKPSAKKINLISTVIKITHIL
jgi:hypothetical protein